MPDTLEQEFFDRDVPMIQRLWTGFRNWTHDQWTERRYKFSINWPVYLGSLFGILIVGLLIAGANKIITESQEYDAKVAQRYETHQYLRPKEWIGKKVIADGNQGTVVDVKRGDSEYDYLIVRICRGNQYQKVEFLPTEVKPSE